MNGKEAEARVECWSVVCRVRPGGSFDKTEHTHRKVDVDQPHAPRTRLPACADFSHLSVRLFTPAHFAVWPSLRVVPLLFSHVLFMNKLVSFPVTYPFQNSLLLLHLKSPWTAVCIFFCVCRRRHHIQTKKSGVGGGKGRGDVRQLSTNM